ncbi:MAG: DivIVA domain-containing protein [Cyclobacteriaceae bacterium]
MRITPLEIRQQNFEKKLRGYDKDEVNAFLMSLSTEWERIVDENKEHKIRLEQAEGEVKKLREVESSLFKTLKTAEDTGANLIDQANKAAELHLKESEMNAEALLSEAKSKAKTIIEEAELQAKDLIVEMQEAIKDLEQNYRTIENQRNTVIDEIRNLSADLIDRLNRTTQQHKKIDLEDHLMKVRKLVRESEARINETQLSAQAVRSRSIPKVSDDDEDEAKKKLAAYIQSKKEEKAKPEVKVEEEDESLTGKGSFFDQVGN